MPSYLSAALRTAKRYADGGGDDPEDESKAWADNSPTVTDVPGVGVVPNAVPPTAAALAQQQVDWFETPGRLMQPLPGEAPFKPGQMVSEEDVAQQRWAQEERQREEVGWGANTALGLAGSEIPFAQEGAIGAFGGTGAPVKAPVVPAADAFSELHPVDVANANKVGDQAGSSPGGTYTGFADGQDRYIKEAKSEDHAKNEKLAAELYKETGVPAANVELTRLPNGKPAISSPIIEGKQLGTSGADPTQLPHLQAGLPADQWLANYDVIGLDHDNVIVDPNNTAHRIDFGGSLLYRAQGKPKTTWGPDVSELQSMLDPNVNQNAAGVFNSNVSPELSQQIFQGRQVTAQRIANVSDDRIRELVNQHGPGSAKTKQELANDLIARRDQIADYYGADKPAPTEPEMPPDKFPVQQYSFDNPKQDMQSMLHNHEWYDNQGKPTGEYNAEGIADNMYKMATLGHAPYVDKLFQHLPEEIQPDVNGHLSQMVEEKGDPWSGEFHPALNALTEPAHLPELEPMSQEDLDALAKHIAKQNSSNKIPSIMQINKTHSPGQLVGALKDYDYMTAASDPTVVTQKQLGKIQWLVNNKSAESLATELAPLSDAEKTNLYSWMTQKQMDKVGDAMADLQSKRAAYEKGPEQYDDDIQEYYDLQHEQEMKELALAQGLENYGGKPITHKFDPDKDYLNSIKPIKWENYKPPGKVRAFTPLDIPKADLEDLKGHGFNPNVELWHGANDMSEGWSENYPQELANPKEYKAHEKAFFTTHKPQIAQTYGKPYSFIARAPKAGQVDWTDIIPPSKEGYASHYEGMPMHQLINAAHKDGYDLLVVHNMYDIGSSEPQTQYLFLNPSGLRAPHANFDPQYLHKAWPLAGIFGGGLYTYGTMKGEKQSGQMARGGKVRSYTVPLHPGSSNKVKSQNISEFHTGPTYAHTKAKFGKARADAQAIAAAYANAKRHPKGKAFGGPNLNMENMVMRGASYGLRHEGMINSSIPGRTDKLGMNVKSGSYILPADIPSALGQGNSMAGGKILSKMFSSGPYGMAPMKSAGRSSMPHMNMHIPSMPKNMMYSAKGGKAEKEVGGHVPIVAAGGEFIIDPAVVRDIGHGDIKKGHKVLDALVLRIRKDHIKTLSKLPPPKK